MNVWHLTADAPRLPRRVPPGDRVRIEIGTWPIGPGQAVVVRSQVSHADGTLEEHGTEAIWCNNTGANSYWRAEMGPFACGDLVTYQIQARDPAGQSATMSGSFRAGPAIFLSILWHQHQPLYKDVRHPTARGSYRQPWVRLHALRDYYSMAALVAEQPRVRVTINFTGVLLWQLEDYLQNGATDRALELTLRPAEELGEGEREEVLATFFDADWHNQVFCHPRYRELFLKRVRAEPFTASDLRDLQVWFSLAWFGQEFRDADVTLVTGETVSVRRYSEQQRDFCIDDIHALVAEQYKILRAVVPIHRELQAGGRIEVSTTPFYHPILPLLVDTDKATVDRPSAALPRRFAHREDAEAQIASAGALYERLFGRPPRGMWPAEGAVSQSVVPLFAQAGLSWIATDAGVLARSGRWGYDIANPDVLCQPYAAREGSDSLSIFFRDTWLSDAIGFRYSSWDDPGAAARAFVDEIKGRFAHRFEGDADRVLVVALDGENAWGAYPNDARTFLRALYALLNADMEIETVCFSEFLDGQPARGTRAHPIDLQPIVHDLFAGSWIDQYGSAPGVDLGTWIGQEEKNRAWELLGDARAFVHDADAPPPATRRALESLYAAEGSDWFWWYGDDHTSGHDDFFDDLFREHLASAYRALGAEPPPALREPIKPRAVRWTFPNPMGSIQHAERLVVETNCPGRLEWMLDDKPAQTADMQPVAGVMAGIERHQLSLGPFDRAVYQVRFRFRCTHSRCQCQDLCCQPDEHTVRFQDLETPGTGPSSAKGGGPGSCSTSVAK